MKSTLFSLILATTLTGCTWFENLKPKEIFYCKVNGEEFRPDKDTSPVGGIGSDPLKVQFIKDDSLLVIDVRNNPKFIGFNIKMANGFIKKGDFALRNTLKESNGFFTSDRNATQVEYYNSTNGTFTITKIDGYNLSGTFEFSCKNAKTGKEYKITEGEFNNISYY